VSLERATALAFSGRLDAAERALARSRTRTEEVRWLTAYLLAARGAFSDAEAALTPLARAARDPALRARAAITLGSVLRQTGRHDFAGRVDERALRLAPDASLRAHALIGLAADAVGLGDQRACGERLTRAARTAQPRDWRVLVRLDWVRAERALLVGRPREAAARARAALARSRRAGARRHEAKSLLFLGVALRQAGSPGARRRLEEAMRLARRLGAAPIASVARGLLSGPGG
jgi:tetratricopeptide (TPR) repeat protein